MSKKNKLTATNCLINLAGLRNGWALISNIPDDKAIIKVSPECDIDISYNTIYSEPQSKWSMFYLTKLRLPHRKIKAFFSYKQPLVKEEEGNE